MAAIRRRLDDLERSRPRPRAGDGPPTGESAEGNTYSDDTGDQMYVYDAEGGWLKIGVPRITSEYLTETATVNAPIANDDIFVAGGWEDFGGPSGTINVPTDGIILTYADADISYSNVPTSGKAYMDIALGQGTWYMPVISRDNAGEANDSGDPSAYSGALWKRMATQPGVFGDVAYVLNAGWVAFAPDAAGEFTFRLYYRARTSSSASAPNARAWFRNVKLRMVVA